MNRITVYRAELVTRYTVYRAEIVTRYTVYRAELVTRYTVYRAGAAYLSNTPHLLVEQSPGLKASPNIPTFLSEECVYPSQFCQSCWSVACVHVCMLPSSQPKDWSPPLSLSPSSFLLPQCTGQINMLISIASVYLTD